MSLQSAPVMLIAGGTGSIGSVIAAQALAAGWHVAVQGRSADSVQACIARLDGNSRVTAIAADIRMHGAIEKMVADAVDQCGRIDAVVDCLVTGPEGDGITGAFAATDPHAYSAFAELSLVYVQRLAQAALPWLQARGGSFITFVSDAGIFAAPRQALVAAARAGAIGFVRNLALEVAAEHVRVNCISSSFVEDTRTAQKLTLSGSDRLQKARDKAGLGLPTPADIAPLAIFLCSDGAKKITGQIISINGGLNA